jgi:aldose 1-epimerase
MVGGGLVTLAAGPLELTLNPTLGGSILRFDNVAAGVRTPVLRGGGPDDDILAAASFPLVPFVNRIRGGQFDFRGRHVSLPCNMAGDVSPLHGQGWLGVWQVVAAGGGSAHLQFNHEAGDWPWAYVAEQHFALTGTGLEIVLSCTNRSPEPMPCGLGQHPFFHCTPATRIATRVTDVWTIDDAVLPVERVPAVGQYDLANRPVCGRGLDHGFAGWGGTALLSDPAWPFAITMSSPDAHFFQLYSPVSGGLLVAEPVTHANAALNAPEAEWAGLGLRVLEPDERMALTMRIDLS